MERDGYRCYDAKERELGWGITDGTMQKNWKEEGREPIRYAAGVFGPSLWKRPHCG